jgi:hypothetical protein
MGLKDRVSKLEGRTPPPSEATGSFAEEIRAIDAEIRAIDEELAGAEPGEETRAFCESLDGLSLDEKIRALEEEIAREEVGRRRTWSVGYAVSRSRLHSGSRQSRPRPSVFSGKL